MKQRAVALAVNNKPLYLLMAKRCIESIRKFNSKIPVTLFTFGDCSNIEMSFTDELGVKHIEKPEVPPHRLAYLKWHAVHDSPAESLLFLDADTYVFDDIETLFNQCADADFYAREEVGIIGSTRMVGNAFIPSILRPGKLEQLQKHFRARPLPFFNSGVMLFNHGLQKQIASLLPDIFRIADYCREHPDTNPLTNTWMIEEVATCVVLGLIPKLRAEFIPKNLAPFYIEFKGNDVPGPGVVIHTWSIYYVSLVKDLEIPIDKVVKSRTTRDMAKIWRLRKSNPSGSGVEHGPETVLLANFEPEGKDDFPCCDDTIEVIRSQLGQPEIRVLSSKGNVADVKDRCKWQNSDLLVADPGLAIQALTNVLPSGKNMLILGLYSRVLGPLEKMFKVLKPTEILGREFLGSSDHHDPRLGNDVIDPAFPRKKVDEICKAFGVPELLVLDSRVLLFGTDVLTRMRSQGPDLLKKIEELRSTELFRKVEAREAYPSLILSIFFHLVPGLIVRTASPQEISFYQEIKGSRVDEPGPLVNIAARYYPYFHEEFNDISGSSTDG